MRPGKTLLLVLMVAPGVVVQGFGVRLGVNPRALGSSTLSAPLQHAVEGVFVSTRVEYRKERDTAAVGGRLGMCAASDRGSGAGGSGGGGKENRRDRKQEETDDDPIVSLCSRVWVCVVAGTYKKNFSRLKPKMDRATDSSTVLVEMCRLLRDEAALQEENYRCWNRSERLLPRGCPLQQLVKFR